uniref:DNA helicase n=1 Tax=Haemonchus contortus TaxID=6289 RepID=A0A7I4YU57_HAECO
MRRGGLKAIVADGVHDLQQDATNKTEQLCVIHGEAGNGIDIPILFAITTRFEEQYLRGSQEQKQRNIVNLYQDMYLEKVFNNVHVNKAELRELRNFVTGYKQTDRRTDGQTD